MGGDLTGGRPTAVLAAMPRELRPVARALGLRRSDLDGRTVWRGPGLVAGTLGVGPRAARRSTARLLDALQPAGVLVVGVAGACDPGLAVADVVVPALVLDVADGTTYEPHPFLPGARAAARTGTLATVDRIGAPAPAGTLAIDMETAAVAAECAARGVPWDVRRAVSDVPGRLPASIGTLLRPDGTADVGAVVRLLARRPAQALTLVRLGRDTGRAVRAVTGAALAAVQGDS